MALAKSNDFAMMTTDDEGIIDSWNTAAHAIFGYAKAEMLGASFAKLFPADVDAPTAVRQILDAARSEGRFADARWLVRRDGGRIFSSAVVMPLTAPGASAFIFILRDATVIEKTLRQREFQLARARLARDDAEAANSLKDEFLAVMSHELKQPLHVVSVNTEILARITEEHISDSPLAARALATISRAVQTQSRIVDDLLDLSRLRTGKLALRLSAVDVVGLVQAALDAASADAHAAEISIHLSCEVPAMLVHGDSSRINQIVWNLLSNAVKFTPANGRIEVGIHEVPGHARIDVVDSGQGMEMAFLAHAFEMFGQAQARARSDQSGIGIGLALARQLAELMGGRVEAHSDGIDQGARFSVYLPLHRSGELHKEAPLAGTPRCDGIRVLVVDDDVETVRGLKTLLELHGAEVDSETSGLAALGRLAATPPDVVITDLGMPGMDGFELLRQAKAIPELRDMPMIALTGFGRESDIQKSLSAGFIAHVTSRSRSSIC